MLKIFLKFNLISHAVLNSLKKIKSLQFLTLQKNSLKNLFVAIVALFYMDFNTSVLKYMFLLVSKSLPCFFLRQFLLLFFDV